MSELTDEDLVGIFNAGRDAGKDDTGVYAVWKAGQGRPVTRVENAGRHLYAFTQLYPQGSVAEWPSGPETAGFATVYDAYKQKLSNGRAEALRAVYELGKANGNT